MCVIIFAFTTVASLKTLTIYLLCKLVIKSLKLHNYPKSWVLKPNNLLWFRANVLNRGITCNYSQDTV